MIIYWGILILNIVNKKGIFQKKNNNIFYIKNKDIQATKI